MKKNSGFPMVYALLVMSVVGISVSMWLVPREENKTLASKDAALPETIGTVRQALEAYKREHNGMYPGARIVAQLTSVTDKTGLPLAHGFRPYLPSIPENPIDGSNDIHIMDEMPPTPIAKADGKKPNGWVYCPQTGEFRANVQGSMPDGTPYHKL